MSSPQKTITTAIIEFLLLSLLMLLTPLILTIDILVFGHGITESSLTEWTQAILIFLSGLRFAIRARNSPRSRALFIPLSGLFFCMFIREMDRFLDETVCKSFWAFPVALIIINSLAYAITFRGLLIENIASFVYSRSYPFILVGIVILLVFSRVFGGGLLWDCFVGIDLRYTIRPTLQEGLELLSYTLIFYGSCLAPSDQRMESQEIRKPLL